jgi:hypothetical protein
VDRRVNRDRGGVLLGVFCMSVVPVKPALRAESLIG